MKYLKIWTSLLSIIQNLEYDEIGRLFEMMLRYADSGEEPQDVEFEGNERFIWPVVKRDIDMIDQRNETNKANGSKGGRPKKQTEPEETEQNPTKPSVSEQNQTEPYKRKEKEEKINKNNESSSSLPPSSFMDDDDAHRIQGDHDKVLDAAQNAGIALNRIVTARLIDLYGEYGLEKMLGAIDACARYAAPNLAYLEAVLKGSPKKAKPKVNAQDYDQRSYEEVSDEIMADQIREMEEWLKQSG